MCLTYKFVKRKILEQSTNDTSGRNVNAACQKIHVIEWKTEIQTQTLLDQIGCLYTNIL